MAHECRKVQRTAFLVDQIKILRKALKVPINSSLQAGQGHTFNLGQVLHHQVAVFRKAGRDRKTAIADQSGGDPHLRRLCQIRIPCDLRIVVGVAVDNTGHEA